MKGAVHPTAVGPKGGARYICTDCQQIFGQRDIQVDHKEPIVPVGITAKDMSWDEIIARTFCDESNLQVLCLECHKKKSKQEVKERNVKKSQRNKNCRTKRK